MADVPFSTLRDARDVPAEALRLVSEYREDLVAAGVTWADFAADTLRRQIQDGTFRGVVWSDTDAGGVGLASWQQAGDFGRRGWVYLARGSQRRTALERLLGRLEGDGGLPFVAWTDDLPGVSLEDRGAVYGPRGFTPVIREDMRLPKARQIRAPPLAPGRSVRPLSLADESELADLLRRVYHGQPELSIFANSLDEAANARDGIRDVLHDKVGRWLAAASFGVMEEGRLLGYTLANELEGGLITEVGVEPSVRRQGLAAVLLARTTAALRQLGFDEPRLVVSLWNPRAARLYRQLGFEAVPGGAGRLWVKLAAFGMSAPAP